MPEERRMTDERNGTENVTQRGPGGLKFGVCALLDLQGFSSHLEISGYDLRTAIGDQAIRRLQSLETALASIEQERHRAPSYYPGMLTLHRINDAIILAMDLDDVLLPAVGQTSYGGSSANRLDEFAKSRGKELEDSLVDEYESAIHDAVDPLVQFMGLASRLHLFIQSRERGDLHPGAKTVVATGFRRPFVGSGTGDDPLSANFALSNAFAASRDLHGPHFYVDNNAVELASRDPFSQNLVRFSHYHWNEAPFDCLAEPGGRRLARSRAEVPRPHDVVLFRRNYLYRRLNASPLAYLQAVPRIRPLLTGDRPADLSSPFYGHVFNAIRSGLSSRMIAEADPPQSFIFGGTNDLSVDISEFEEFLTKGHDATTHARHERRRLAELGLRSPEDNPDLWRALDDLDRQVVKIDAEPLNLLEFLPALWSMSEETISGLLPFFIGDRSLLDFPSELS